MSTVNPDVLLDANPLKAVNGTLSFGFVTGEKQVSDAIAQNVRTIFKSLIEPFVDITFVEVSEGADIQFQLHDSEAYNYYAYELSHTVYLNRAYDHADNTNGFQSGFGSHGFMSVMHETLHAMGLKHPGNYSGNEVGEGPFLPYALDNTTNSVMSYNFAGKGVITPMPYDIAALQSLYGEGRLNLGRTVYKFSSVYSFTDGKRSWGDAAEASKLTLFDGGGRDILDFSSLALKQSGYVLDARAAGIFTESVAYNNFSYTPIDRSVDETPTQTTSSYGTRLSFGTQVEKIFGSESRDTIFAGDNTQDIVALGGDDVVQGRDRKNRIWGGKGSDTIWGGIRNDQLIGGEGGTTDTDANGDDVLYGGDGRDKLWGEGGDDELYGQAQTDVLYGGGGNDLLQGTEDLITSERDQLLGGTGQDRFVLGSREGAFYQGSGYAIIKDWEAGIDRLQFGASNEQDKYTLDARELLGGGALDTGVYFDGDLIGVIENTTAVTRSDFIFV